MAVDLLEYLKTNPFVLAPMAGITDSCFRTFMRELGCGVVVSELVSAHGIEHKSHRTLQLMDFAEPQRPVGIQLFGETPEILALGAQVVEAAGADFVDLNFGCPVPKVVKKGAGSAILKDLPQVARVFRAVRAATQLPVTVKIRTGWDENSRNADQVAQIAYDEGLTWVAIHGRTRAAGYSGLSDWDYIAGVKAGAKIPIIGNGDIHGAESAVQRLKESGCDGVMIGRGCLKNPWVFREAMSLWQGHCHGPRHGLRHGLWHAQDAAVERLAGLPVAAQVTGSAACLPTSSDKDFVRLFVKLQAAYEHDAKADEKITMLQIKKFASWYSSGYPGASNFRKSIFQTKSLNEVMDATLGFFNELKSAVQFDTSNEAFLMGGHG